MSTLSNLDFLPIAGMDYEATRIRKINPNDPEDFARVYKIDQDPEVRSTMVDVDDTTEDIIEFIEGSTDEVLFGIAGWSKVSEQEKGRLQGWVYVYAESDVTKRVQRALGSEALFHSNIVEISYAKVPRAATGQMSSALRQVCKLIEQEDRQGYIHQYPDPLYIPQSLHASTVIKSKGTIVVAFASDDNPRSVRVLERAGFVRRSGEMAWDPKQPKDLVSLFVLDWDLLDQIIQQKSAQHFFQ